MSGPHKSPMLSCRLQLEMVAFLRPMVCNTSSQCGANPCCYPKEVCSEIEHRPGEFGHVSETSRKRTKRRKIVARHRCLPLSNARSVLPSPAIPKSSCSSSPKWGPTFGDQHACSEKLPCLARHVAPRTVQRNLHQEALLWVAAMRKPQSTATNAHAGLKELPGPVLCHTRAKKIHLSTPRSSGPCMLFSFEAPILLSSGITWVPGA